MADIRTVELGTTGMHCGSCAMLIDMTLGDLEGVSEVKTEYSSGVTTVTYDSAILSENDLLIAVRSAGYDASVR
jgi:Cu+-exporting ATPase